MSWAQIASGEVRLTPEEKILKEESLLIAKLEKQLAAKDAEYKKEHLRLCAEEKHLEKKSMAAAKETLRLHQIHERVARTCETVGDLCGEAIALSKFVKDERDWDEISEAVETYEWSPNYY